ncbi:MAG: S9 family peptidase [Sphingobacteriales bacterium]|jgi:dipeptidyl-peptidase-4|nr:S9 family peptidase [Sphingobacteriales bacterium]
MTKNILFLLLYFVSSYSAMAQSANSASATTGQAITLDDIWLKYSYYPETTEGFDFMKDGKTYSRMERFDNNTKITINQYDIADGKRVKNLLEADAKLDIGGYAFDSAETQLLLSTQEEALYRHSSVANYQVYDIKSKQLKAVSDKGKQRIATFDPSGNKIAFVRDNNLHIKDINNNTEQAITTNGKANAIINGAPDWVYEEEFSMDRAYYWSPSGSKIAYLRFDESAVPSFLLTEYDGGLYPTYSSFKYPKAGEPNSKVSLHIYDLATQKTIDIAIKDTAEYYIPRFKWSPDGNLCFFKLNRHQNDLSVYKVNATSGELQLWFREKNPSYVEVAPGTDVMDNFLFLANGNAIGLSEEDGFNHIYQYNANGTKKQLTKGGWEVTKLYGVDEKRSLIYYQSTEESPLQRHIYVVDVKGANKKCLTLTQGWNDAEFSATFDYFILTHSTINSPSDITVYDYTGRKQRDLVSNTTLREKQRTCNVSDVEFFKFTTPDNVLLNGWMIKPQNMQANKKYPVLMYVYGGPASQEAVDQWNTFDYWWFQMLAQQGYIVACVDGRGTGGRGESFKKCTYKQLGKWETNDQIEAAKWLGKQSYIDPARIGIFGWSYGGYMSLLAILKGNDVFKSAIAVAPVTNWKWYDSIYTERFLQTPEENKGGYENNSPINFADRLKGNLLIVHGDADDNVHYQNTAEMVKALVDANKQFDFMAYPNKNHGIAGGYTRYHLYTKMTNFLKEKL